MGRPLLIGIRKTSSFLAIGESMIPASQKHGFPDEIYDTVSELQLWQGLCRFWFTHAIADILVR
jgi:hypothetical protein